MRFFSTVRECHPLFTTCTHFPEDYALRVFPYSYKTFQHHVFQSRSSFCRYQVNGTSLMGFKVLRTTTKVFRKVVEYWWTKTKIRSTDGWKFIINYITMYYRGQSLWIGRFDVCLEFFQLLNWPYIIDKS